MQRETKTIKTPAGNELVLLSFITGREQRQLTSVYLDNGVSVDPVTGAVQGIKNAIITQGQDLSWKLVIVSFNGKKDGVDGFNIVEAILDLSSDETNFVTTEVDKIVNDATFKQKKT
jgi:hypothetical protein